MKTFINRFDLHVFFSLPLTFNYQTQQTFVDESVRNIFFFLSNTSLQISFEKCHKKTSTIEMYNLRNSSDVIWKDAAASVNHVLRKSMCSQLPSSPTFTVCSVHLNSFFSSLL